MNRRQVVLAMGCLAATPLRAADQFLPLLSDTGVPVSNERVPADLYPSSLPGAVLAGSHSPDVILIEFFDYNCPTCRGCAPQLDDLVSADPNLQLRLFNNAILSPASIEAAKVQQAVLRANGPDVAYRFHRRLLSRRGIANRESALATAHELGVDMRLVLAGTDLPRVASVVAAQLESAKSLDLTATPSFLIGGVEVLGWPGPKQVASMVRSVRSCDEPACATDSRSAQTHATGRGPL